MINFPPGPYPVPTNADHYAFRRDFDSIRYHGDECANIYDIANHFGDVVVEAYIPDPRMPDNIVWSVIRATGAWIPGFRRGMDLHSIPVPDGGWPPGHRFGHRTLND